MSNTYLFRLLLFAFLGCVALRAEAQVLLAQTTPNFQREAPGQPRADRKSLALVLKELVQQRNLYFSYDEKTVANKFVPTPSRRGGNVEKILTELLKNTGLRFQKVNGNTFLILEELPPVPPATVPTKSSAIEPLPERHDVSLSAFHAGLRGISPLTLPSVSRVLVAVSGKVTDETGAAVVGATVRLKGNATVGTTTNAEGAFSLNLPDGDGTLVISSVGYLSQEVVVGNRTTLDVRLKSSTNSLDEVVVIGYGSVKKSDITGSVSSVKVADLKGTQILSAAQALQGRAAGVQVFNSDATPGARPNIRIRGTNSLGTSSEPLFVIDGYPSNEDINSINPNDIESIEILKDASATAIYGSRGANGVILITTKRGETGKLAINVEAYYGVATVTKTLPVMNARQYAEYRNDVVRNIGAPTARPFASPALLDYFSTHSTDWQAAMFEQAPVSDVQLNLSGGDEKTRYLLSGEWYKQAGVVRNTGFERGNLRFNFDRKISQKFTFGLTAVLGRTLTQAALTNTNGGTEGGTVLNLLRLNPAVPVYGPNGAFSYGNTVVKDADSDPASVVDLLGNPIAYAERVTNNNYVNRGQLSAFGEYEILEGLKFKLLLGGEYLNTWQNFYAPYELFEQAQNIGTASRTNGNRLNWLNENNLTYTRNFGPKHSLSALLGVSFQKFKYETNTALATNFFTNAFTFNNLGAGAAAAVSSTASQNQLNSFYGRVNATLYTNLLLTATLRADGSSKFGKNNKFGYFPSAAVAYKLSDLPFVRQLKIVNEVKVRAGYGVTGNQEINPYLSVFGYDLASAFSPGVLPGAVVFGSTRQIAVSANRPANPDLKWEQTSSFNAGLDLSLWNNRLSLTLDYYTKQTRDLLWSVALPATTGFTSAFKNLGSIENRGWELSLSGDPFNANGFRWNSSLNVAVNRNKIRSLGDEPQRLYGANTMQALITRDNFIILKPGEEIGKFFLYEFDGIWQSQEEINGSAFTTTYKNSLKPGYARYKDLNGDGTINVNDKKIYEGSAYPKFVFGFTNTFSYKGFELNVFLQGQQGNQLLNLNKYWMEYPVESNKSADVVNRWKGPGTSNTLPGAGYETSRQLAQDFLEDGSYLRLKSLSLGYQLPARWLQSAPVRSLRLYATATNLLTLTRYTGFDPEVNSYSGNLFLQGVDQGAYPVSQSLIFGAKIGF